MSAGEIGRSLNSEIIDRIQRSFQTEAVQATPGALQAVIEGMARLNLTLAEREFDLQMTRNNVVELEHALHRAYRAIKNSPIEHRVLDDMDLIEDLIDVNVPHTADAYQQQQLRDEKFAALRKAQQQVAKVRDLSGKPDPTT